MKLCNLLALPLLITSWNCNAGIGQVTEQLNTPALIQRKTENLQGIKGQQVEMLDSIRTQQGKVGITFEDNTRVQVNENSKLVIDDFVYDPKSKGGKLGAKVALGTVRYASGQIAKTTPQNVALNTPTATISVRGTDFTATVEEFGQSTVILLPSCPDDKPTRTKNDIASNCIVGEIIVESDAGTVILNQPFQATRVESRSAAPSRPVILNLSEDAIGNMIILSPPKELKDSKEQQNVQKSYLDVDFLATNGLENALDKVQMQIWQDKLSYTFLDNSFLNNVFDMIADSLNEKLLDEVDTVLPDYRKSSGVIAVKDDPFVTLCRDSGQDKQCVTTPINQSATLTQTQGSVTIKNRINQGTGTVITLIQR
jgi:hypothetical protein